jgi:hypothetical protein
MNALKQRVERKRAITRDHDLAVEDERLCLELADRVDQFGIVAGERLPRFRLQLDLVAVAKCQAAKAVPLRLVLPLLAGRDVVDRQRFHRRQGGMQRQNHRNNSRQTTSP